MKNRPLYFAMLGTLMLTAAATTFGGWAVVTVDDMPEYAVAGKAIELPFTVRQHGVTLLGDLNPTLVATNGDTELTARARAAKDKGHYIVSFTPPSTAVWTLRIRSGFGNSESKNIPLRVVANGAAAPRKLADAERGHQLFVAKGCVTCHMRGDDGADGLKLAPELSGRRYVPEYLARFLADPVNNRLTQVASNNRMPQLDLQQSEIASLIAFINSETKAKAD
ncbi:MAG: cytochrome c [Gemmatimonadaceae bacterium]